MVRLTNGKMINDDLLKNIPGWFPQASRDLLDDLIERNHVKTVLEIGTFVGLSTSWFAQRVQRVITVDPFDAINRINYLNDDLKKIAQFQYLHFEKNTAPYDNITVIPVTSENAFRYIVQQLFGGNVSIDLVYIDGSHEYEDVYKDIKMWNTIAKKVICGDDYSPHWPGVVRAVDECLPEANKSQRLWYLEKK